MMKEIYEIFSQIQGTLIDKLCYNSGNNSYDFVRVSSLLQEIQYATCQT